MLLFNSTADNDIFKAGPSFNPCFTGCCSSTRPRHRKEGVLLQTFQSLFYWMLLFNERLFHRAEGFLYVSILVLLDVALQRAGYNSHNSGLQVSILVLLDVALQLRKENTGDCGLFHGFNPCFTGCCSSTTAEAQGWEVLWRCFNPCFTGCCSSTDYW